MRSWFLAGVVLAAPAAMGQVTVELPASRDNTLYQPIPSTPETSNGAGEYIFCGQTGTGFNRRALILFDLSSIPVGSTIVEASIRLHMSLTIAPTQMTGMHRVLADWGEGPSDADRNEGGGAIAQPGDATWFNRFFPGSPWTTAGGDFSATPSAVKAVDQAGFYTWGPEAQLTADCQAYVDGSLSNFGWVLVGNETTPVTAKRFDSRENLDPSVRPVMSVTYLPPPSCDPDLNQDGNVDQDDVSYLINVIGGGENPTGIDPDFNGDGNADQDDVLALINTIGGAGCP
jgi:hypothetical protein